MNSHSIRLYCFEVEQYNIDFLPVTCTCTTSVAHKLCATGTTWQYFPYQMDKFLVVNTWAKRIYCRNTQ